MMCEDRTLFLHCVGYVYLTELRDMNFTEKITTTAVGIRTIHVTRFVIQFFYIVMAKLPVM